MRCPQRVQTLSSGLPKQEVGSCQLMSVGPSVIEISGQIGLIRLMGFQRLDGLVDRLWRDMRRSVCIRPVAVQYLVESEDFRR